MSFFCIETLRLAIKTADIDSVLILFMGHKRSLWKCQVQITGKWNPVLILILVSSTHFYSAHISICMDFFLLILPKSEIQNKKKCLEYCLKTHAQKHTYTNLYLF